MVFQRLGLSVQKELYTASRMAVFLQTNIPESMFVHSEGEKLYLKSRLSLCRIRPIGADFIVTVAYLPQNSGWFLASVISQTFTLLNSPTTSSEQVDCAFKTWARLLLSNFLEVYKGQLPGHIWAKYPVEISFESWISSRVRHNNYSSLASRRKSRSKGLLFQEIISGWNRIAWRSSVWKVKPFSPSF